MIAFPWTGSDPTRRLPRIASILLPLLLSLLACGAIVAASGGNPAAAFGALAFGAFGTPEGFASTLTKAVPLMLVGLGVAFGLRGGVFNIGGEGQLYAGGIGAAAVGLLPIGLPGAIHLPAVLLAGACAGGVWGAIPGWLKRRRGVHEVIATIMMNYIAIHLADYLVNGPMSGGAGGSRTAMVPDTAVLPLIWSVPPAGLGWGFPLALAGCVLLYLCLFRTPFGYEVRAVGHNPEAARAVGIDPGRVAMRVLAIGGTLAGLAGAVEVCGVHRTLYAQFSPGYGFDAIAVALLARNHPLGVIPAALLFGGLRTADRYLQLSAGVPRDLVVLMQAAVVFFAGAELLGERLARRFARPPGR